MSAPLLHDVLDKGKPEPRCFSHMSGWRDALDPDKGLDLTSENVLEWSSARWMCTFSGFKSQRCRYLIWLKVKGRVALNRKYRSKDTCFIVIVVAYKEAGEGWKVSRGENPAGGKAPETKWTLAEEPSGGFSECSWVDEELLRLKIQAGNPAGWWAEDRQVQERKTRGSRQVFRPAS